MIDLHTHLLPGVDDGSPTLENSLRVIHGLAAQGVTEIACTPHLDASVAHQAPVEEYRALLGQLRADAPPGVRLHSGFEIMLDKFGCDLRAPALALGDSRAVLVEMPRVPLTSASTDELLRLRSSGVVPVIAHPERYKGMRIDTLHVWRDMGVVVQGDGMMLLASGPKGDLSRKMLAAGVMDIIASDNHGDTRSLATIRLWLHEIGADRQAKLLLETNPAHVLKGELLQAVPPFQEQKGIWKFLKSLFRGGGSR